MMRKMIAGAAAMLAALTTAPVASAQLAPGYSGTSGIRYGGEEEFWWAVRQLGECFAAAKTERARALLATQPGSAQERGASSGLLGNATACLRHFDRLSFTNAMLRGTLAEHLYKRSLAQGAAAPAAQARASTEAAPIKNILDFSACFARERPDEVHRLLTTTRLGSREERTELIAMAPEFSRCLPATRQQLDMAAPLVRLFLAEALHHRSVGAAGLRSQ